MCFCVVDQNITFLKFSTRWGVCSKITDFPYFPKTNHFGAKPGVFASLVAKNLAWGKHLTLVKSTKYPSSNAGTFNFQHFLFLFWNRALNPLNAYFSLTLMKDIFSKIQCDGSWALCPWNDYPKQE